MSNAHFDSRRKLLKHADDDMHILVTSIAENPHVLFEESFGVDRPRTLLGKYATTVYRMHYNDLPTKRWVQIFMAISVFINDIEKHFVKDGKFKLPKFFGWFPIVKAVLKLIKSLFNEAQ